MLPEPACAVCGTPVQGPASACPVCATDTAIEAAAFPELPGFRVIRLLGRGGMGAVYLADDLTLGRKVAIKVLAEKYHGNSEARDRFLREARALAGIDHPNVLRIHSLGEAQGSSFIVMEYVEGESLARRISRGPIAANEVLRIARQAAAGLAAAWEKGIVHRDVKPSNILLDSTNQVRVADFGLAKPVHVDASFTTSTGIVLGTPHYVSPEQARGEPVELRSDIYSLGVALYEMATGRRPFTGATPVEVLAHHLHSPMPALPSPASQLTPRLGRAISRMTEKRAADRPGSYQELSELLQETKEPTAYRGRFAALASAVLGIALVVGVVVYVRSRGLARPGSVDWSTPEVVTYDEANVDVLPVLRNIGGREFGGIYVRAARPSESAPGAEKEEGCLGTVSVLVEFVVTETGEVTEIAAQSPVVAGEDLLSLSRRKYSPALKGGNPVRVRQRARYTYPSDFRTLEGLRSQADSIEKARLSAEKALGCVTVLEKALKGPDASFHDEALRALVALPTGYPMDGSELRELGQFLLDASLPGAATRIFEIALARLPETAREYEQIADGFARAGEQVKAQRAYRLALGLDPGRASARTKVDALKPAPTTVRPEGTYNGANVYAEADVEKSPLLFAHDVPKPKLEPGRVVSITVSWIVTPEGLVDDPQIVTSASPEIDAFVINGIRKWRYEPGQKDGKTVPVRVLRKYTFGQRSRPEPSPSPK